MVDGPEPRGGEGSTPRRPAPSTDRRGGKPQATSFQSYDHGHGRQAVETTRAEARARGRSHPSSTRLGWLSARVDRKAPAARLPAAANDTPRTRSPLRHPAPGRTDGPPGGSPLPAKRRGN